MSLSLPVPPRQSITPKPKKIIEDLQIFQEQQYELFSKIINDLEAEETEHDQDVITLIDNELNSYSLIWDYIDKL